MLVSVVIPTWNRAEILRYRTIPSILEQTYKDFEIVVVGDCCTDNTPQLLAEFKDPRIRWQNLTKRGPYPDNPVLRWYVAGTHPLNRGYELAKGDWIFDLDDDDEFYPNHIKDLLDTANAAKADFVYGKCKMVSIKLIKNIGRYCGQWPPVRGRITRCTLAHKRSLNIRANIDAWKLKEPGDWNLIRTQMERKVKMAFCDKVVSIHYDENSNMRKEMGKK
ncbi:MAG: glycosyltransferase family A protein [Candidatus Paceibacterota bacterium]|jgi:glycosyltransferase involved in cell wall biosynthesis